MPDAKKIELVAWRRDFSRFFFGMGASVGWVLEYIDYMR